MNERSQTLVAYLGGELSADQEQTLEQQLFAGELDGGDLTDLANLTIGLREAAFLGILSVQVSRGEMERIRTLGYRILECRIRAGVETVLDISGDFDLIFLEFEMDLTGATRIDCEVCDHLGNVIKRNLDLPFSPDQKVVSGFCARELALTGVENNPEGMMNRWISVEPGGERIIGEFRTRAILPE